MSCDLSLRRAFTWQLLHRRIYWGLRDYGTAQWDGGDAGCDHTKDRSSGIASSGLQGGKGTTNHQHEASYRDSCKCGARRIDQQLGLEATPEEYVATMVDVFREVRRVLRDDGTLWLNIGDSYAAQRGGSAMPAETLAGGVSGHGDKAAKRGRESAYLAHRNAASFGLKHKDLVGVPWMLAFALRADGWWLRQDIIWAKPNPMPESVTDRCTKAHEYMFLLSKSARYYWDGDAVRESHARTYDVGCGVGESFRGDGVTNAADRGAGNNGNTGLQYHEPNPAGRNKRSVWTIATEAYSEAHFATFPQALVKPCILAGTSEHGVCSECGAPWARVTERELVATKGNAHANDRRDPFDAASKLGGVDDYRSVYGHYNMTTTGWAPTCKHEAPVVPATVLDPFLGSGTTAMVAKALGRHAIGIDLNSAYLAMAAKRCAQMGLM